VDQPGLVCGIEGLGDLGEDPEAAPRIELPGQDQILQGGAVDQP
jgi:hypothetical protein